MLNYLECLAPHDDIFFKSRIFIRSSIYSFYQDWLDPPFFSCKNVRIQLNEPFQVFMMSESSAIVVFGRSYSYIGCTWIPYFPVLESGLQWARTEGHRRCLDPTLKSWSGNLTLHFMFMSMADCLLAAMTPICTALLSSCDM